ERYYYINSERIFSVLTVRSGKNWGLRFQQERPKRMSIHIIYKDPLNSPLEEDDDRKQEIVEKFSAAGLEIAAIRSIIVDDLYDVQIVLFGSDEAAARKVVEEIVGPVADDEIFLEYLPDEDDKTEVRPMKH